MGFIVIILLFANLALSVLASGFAIMLISLFLHNSWWEAIPALGFTESILIGVLFACFQMATTLSEAKVTLSGAITNGIIALILVPLVTPWIVDLVNNELIPVMPDISYGTSLLFTLIGIGVTIPCALLLRLTDDLSDNR